MEKAIALYLFCVLVHMQCKHIYSHGLSSIQCHRALNIILNSSFSKPLVILLTMCASWHTTPSRTKLQLYTWLNFLNNITEYECNCWSVQSFWENLMRNKYIQFEFRDPVSVLVHRDNIYWRAWRQLCYECGVRIELICIIHG